MQFEGCESSLLDNSEVVWLAWPAMAQKLGGREEGAGEGGEGGWRASRERGGGEARSKRREE